MFAIEWQIAPGNPRSSHWINVLLYVLTAFMLFVALALFFEKQNIVLPFIATILFVAHPIHTEVVANIKSRDEILCLLYRVVGCREVCAPGRKQYLAMAGISIFLAMLSKETAVAMVIMAPMTVDSVRSGIKTILMSDCSVSRSPLRATSPCECQY